MPRHRRVDRRLHGLPAAARRGARLGGRCRPDAARLEAAHRSARGGSGHTNARLSCNPPISAKPCDLAVCDVSFISVTLILPALPPLLDPGRRNGDSGQASVRGRPRRGGQGRHRARSRSSIRPPATRFARRSKHSASRLRLSTVPSSARKAIGSFCFMPPIENGRHHLEARGRPGVRDRCRLGRVAARARHTRPVRRADRGLSGHGRRPPARSKVPTAPSW